MGGAQVHLTVCHAPRKSVNKVTMAPTSATPISVIAELELLGESYLPAGPNEIKVLCPFHDDKDPSCCMNTETLLFNCKACQAKGDFVHWMAQKLKTTRHAIYALLSKRYELEEVKVVDPSVVEAHHARIFESGPLLQALYERGILNEDIRKHRLGVMPEGRISIPIKNAGGIYVNIRRYLPGAPGPQKMKNLSGRGQMRLFPLEQMAYETIVICGGEMKAILAARLLNPKGIGAVTSCGGEGNWSHKLTPEFAGKRIYIMMDIDDAGHRAAMKIAQMLKGVAQWVKIIELPLDRDKYPKGDVNDFVAREKGELFPLLATAKEWCPPTSVVDENEEPLEVKFSETIESENVGKRMLFSAVVSAAVERPFMVPKNIRVNCGKGEECCPLCAVYPQDKVDFPVAAESAAILQMVSAPQEKLDKAIRQALGVPGKCRDVAFEVLDHWKVEDVRINPSLDITNSDGDRTLQQAVCVQCEAELNNTYEFVGRLYPHPQTQQATLVVSRSKTTHDALSKYVPQRLSELGIFRPIEWTKQAVQTKLAELYDDFAANVTRIFLRSDIHLFVDLSYHSPLLIRVDGKDTKGWTDILVMGDSACGKTEVANGLRSHYGLGVKTEVKNASLAGLLGGLRQMGTQWFVAWGVIPTNDRRHVTMEEIKGLDVGAISRLTDMRSGGVAEIPKIERRATLSRVRLLWLSNARLDRHMSTYAFGVEAIRDLIGAPEDVRRFDAALIVVSEDATSEQHGKLSAEVPHGESKYPSDLCRELILWAWTRMREEVVVEPETAEYISDIAGQMCKTYSELIPLVDGGSMRHKLTRLAAAVAVRTFSATDDMQSIIVRKCHAEFVVDLLERVYSSKSFGYRFFSEKTKASSTLRNPDEIRIELERLGEPKDIQERLLHSDMFDVVDIMDWCGYDRVQAQNLISVMMRKRAIHRDDSGRKYRKSSEFIVWLRSIELVGAPAHMRRDSNGKF